MWNDVVFLGQWALLALVGICSGLSVASGVFTVFTAVGLVPRFAQHTGSGKHIMQYENMIVLGCFLGNLFSLYAKKLLEANFSLPVWGLPLWWQRAILIVTGLFLGVYVGTLALSIAEMLDAIPIMAHRMKLKQGVSVVIASLAVGKLLGSLFYFWQKVYLW